MTATKHFPLLSLPTELQLLIIAHQTVPERELLRFTGRHFYNLLPPAGPWDRDAIEASPYNRHLFCHSHICQILHPISNYKAGPELEGYIRRPQLACKSCDYIYLLTKLFWNKGAGFDEVARQREELGELRKKQGLDDGKWYVADTEVFNRMFNWK